MADRDSKPIRLLTPFRMLPENWPAEVAVEFVFASHPDEYPELMPGVDVVIAHNFNREMAKSADALKLIQNPGAGYELIELEAVPPGVCVCNAYGHEGAVSEWVLMAMIALDRRLFTADRTLRAGSWELSGRHGIFSPGLAGQTLGIVGFGRIGKRLAAIAQTFGMRVISATRTPPPSEDWKALGLTMAVGMDKFDSVLSESDFVVLTLAYNEQTKGLLDRRALEQMKPTAHVVNVARGGVVEEEALYAALKDGRIASAALDVWWNEPEVPSQSPSPSSLPFNELDNVIMSPHASATTNSMLRDRVMFFANQVRRIAAGEPLENVVYRGG
jgi:phosphoglycerate dehydrogenase-like enzyme